ncbi:Cytochrome P450, E-class, group I [Parasponia andersonii]|uniref:Cytochrome P450, E-class, group I n=1 Tax=Parasponia andersonii TaxID=3476 RepID=A0A2P5BD87_PARAD|nr:Cytochrome P450, E-class, group I [Parasponia andersonii]
MEIFICLPLLLLPIFLYLYFHSSPKRKSKTGFKIYPLVGTLPELLRNRHRFLDWVTETLVNCPTNTTIFARSGTFHLVMTANPSNVEHMLKINFDNYPKANFNKSSSILDDFFGQGFFNSDGEIWRVQRKTASYEFNTKTWRNLVMENVVTEIEKRFIRALEKASKSGQVVDLQDIMERFAFDNICKLVLNFDPGCLGEEVTADGEELMRVFQKATVLSSGRLLYIFPFLWKIKRFFNLGSERSLRESIAIVHRFVNASIRSKTKTIVETVGEEELLSRFIRKDIKNSFLRDSLISFILAGQDTTSSALTWFVWLVSSRPEIQQNILKELESIRTKYQKNIGDFYTYAELREMHYLHAAISETMRLYPPVPVNSRFCKNDDVMPDGTFVGKGWTVHYNAYAMGRMESIWGKNCDEFQPERWLQDGMFRPESPCRFPAFHAGPRMCLGKDMAYIQMKSIAASLIERFEIKLEEKGTCPAQLLALTLKMKDGLPVTVGVRKT